MWQDITYSITEKTPPYPGQPEVKINHLCKIKDGAASNVTLLDLSAHTGTHMDAPLHFIEDAQDITQLPLDIAMGKGKVIEILNNEAIYVDEIKSFEEKYGEITSGERIFFKTGNSKSDWSQKPFNEDYIFLSKEAAQYLIDKRAGMVGIDYLSISKGDINMEVHQILLGNNCWIVEGLDLRAVSEGTYEIICLPIKIKGADGAPARVLIKSI